MVDELATGRDRQQSIEELAAEAPAIEEILDEIAIDELVDQAPTLEETAPGLAPRRRPPATEDADAPSARAGAADADDTPTSADVRPPTSAPTSTSSPRTARSPPSRRPSTDEGVADAEPGRPRAGPSPPRPRTPEPRRRARRPPTADATAAATDDPRRSRLGPQAAGAAPIDGYDSFSIAQLRGRLRGYALSTVADLRRLRAGHPGPRALPPDAAQPAGEARGAGGRVQPARPARRLSRRRHAARAGRAGPSGPHGTLGA